MQQTFLRRYPGTTGAVLFALLFSVISFVRAAEAPPKPLFPAIAPVCSPESLKNVSLPNTTIESVVVDAPNGMCRVTATVTHPPAGDHVTVWIGLPLAG